MEAGILSRLTPDAGKASGTLFPVHTATFGCMSTIVYLFRFGKKSFHVFRTRSETCNYAGRS